MAVAAAGQPGFIFSTDGKSAPSYDQLQKRRKVFEALMAQQMGARAPQNVGEGIYALGQGIVAGLEGRALKKAEAESAEAQKKIWGDLSSIGMASGGAGPSFGAGAGYGSATGPISDASPTPSGTVDATSALPQSFLASVDRTEGGGDYDTLFGHSQRSGPFSNVRISGMTVGQAIDFASPSGAYGQYVKGKVGRVATPMGRHQIVGTTLRNAAAEMGLDPSTPFNQQTQDSIAAHLARKRVASADSMPGKIAALRSEWEGFRHVPDAQMATIVADLQNGGGSTAPAAPVQVASLDPSAGVAEATRAGASVSTAPTTGGQQPVPANVPVPTAREAIEKAMARVGVASPAEFGAEDVAALEARPRDPQAVAYAGPGATIDPRDVPQLQGDASAPMPTPRPDMQQAAPQASAGIPPQAVAASAMAQEPAPFDPVNGTAMGGNTGAADAAKAAYLEANGRAPAVQRVAQVMTERGIPAEPRPPVSEAVQRVAVAQQQGQAQGRYQQLMGVVMNPAASPEQRQYAAGLLEQDRQFQTQQQTRAYDMWKTRQGWDREDQRFAVEDRREDARLRLEQEKAAREASQPIEVGGVLVDRRTMQPVYQAPQQPFTLQPGETRFDGAGNQIAAGGAKPGYRTLSADEVKTLGLPPGSYQAGPDGKIDDIGGKGQTINVGGGENKQVFDAMQASTDAARAASTGLNALSEAKRALDAGIISGAGADWRLGLQKVGAAFGVVDPAVIQNTETFRASIAPQVAAVMKATVGSTQISNADREFAAQAAGGSINLDAGSISRLVDIMDRASRVAIQSHLERLDTVYPANGQFDRERALFGIRMPDPLTSAGSQSSANAAAPATAAGGAPAMVSPQPNGQRYEGGVPVGGGAQPPPAMPQRATNPQTGQVIELRNGQWVPVQ